MSCTSLKFISSNITHHKKLTLYTREVIVEKSEKEAILTQIECDLNVFCIMIIDTLNHDLKCNNRAVKLRSERLKIYTECQEHIILKTVYADLKLIYQKLKNATEVTISHCTIYC